MMVLFLTKISHFLSITLGIYWPLPKFEIKYVSLLAFGRMMNELNGVIMSLSLIIMMI